MTTPQSPPSFALLFAVIGALALLGLTACQTPALGIGVPIEKQPTVMGTEIPNLPAVEG